MAISQYLIGLTNYVTFVFLETLLINFFVKTCISVSLLVLLYVSKLLLKQNCLNNCELRYTLLFFLKNFFFISSDHTVRIAYLGFHTLYFEHWVFLLLDNVLSYCYNKDTQRNQNKVINGRNIVFCFSDLRVL